jgi:hypothetical protein
MAPKLSSFRGRGIIPAKRHDAFLLALLLAVLFNVGIFVLQAILPKIALLISLLGATPLPPPENSQKEIPFILVDPSLFDDQEPELPPDAFGSASQEARQVEDAPQLDEELSAYVAEGQEDLLFLPPGELVPPNTNGNAPEDAQQPQEPTPEHTETPVQEPAEPVEAPAEPVESVEAAEPAQQLEPLPELQPLQEIAPPPEPTPEPEPLPREPVIEEIPEPAYEEPPPEPLEEVEPIEPSAPEEPVADQPADPVSDIIDLASLPVSPEGFVDTTTREMQELLNQRQPFPQPMPQERPREEQTVPVPQPTPQAREPRDQPQEPRRARPQPVFKQIGGENRRTGTAPRRQTNTSVKLLGDDASMRVLMHRYGAYMDKLGRQLQESLIRQMVLNPLNYSRGQVKIRFGIAPDGSLSYYDTVFVEEGMISERILSERTLVEAAPFDPLTDEMAADENFQNMTVVVNLL